MTDSVISQPRLPGLFGPTRRWEVGCGWTAWFVSWIQKISCRQVLPILCIDFLIDGERGFAATGGR